MTHDPITEDLTDEYFEERVTDKYDSDAYTLTYHGVISDDAFLFQLNTTNGLTVPTGFGNAHAYNIDSWEGYLRLPLDDLCRRILASDDEWPDYIPHALESTRITVNPANNPSTLFPTYIVSADEFPASLPLQWVSAPVDPDDSRDSEQLLVDQTTVAQHLARHDRRCTVTLDDPLDSTDISVTYPARISELDLTVEFEFPRPGAEDSERFDRLVDLCGGSPKFIPETELELVPRIDTRRELATCDRDLWALVTPKSSHPSLLARLLSRIR